MSLQLKSLYMYRNFTFYNTEEGVLDSVDDSILDARHMRKTKIVATIGPTSNTQEAIIELGDKGVNVCRLNMSHGDHASHEAVVEKIKHYNSLDRGCLAILLDTKVQTDALSVYYMAIRMRYRPKALWPEVRHWRKREFPVCTRASSSIRLCHRQACHIQHTLTIAPPYCSGDYGQRSQCCDSVLLCLWKIVPFNRSVGLIHSARTLVQGPEVRSGDLSEPAELVPGDEWVFTIKEGETGEKRRISVNYDGFVQDVSEGDVLLVDGGICTFEIMSITSQDVICKVSVRAGY
jgi:hypothetical protein